MSVLSPLILYILGSIFVFLQQNLQYINSYWKGKDLLVVLIFSAPTCYCFVKSWAYLVDTTGSTWSARFIFFGLSYLTFPFLAYYLLGEETFTTKNLVCSLLSVMIIIVQYKF